MSAITLRKRLVPWTTRLVLAAACVFSQAQTLPTTPGETLSGTQLVLAQAVEGHAAVVIASFSKDAGSGGDAWAKAIRLDAALAGVAVYQAAMLERAPGFIRSMVKSGLRKQTPSPNQDHFVVLVQDEPLWRTYFGVTTDKDPYVVLLDSGGRILWHGHGEAQHLEPLLKAALR